MYKEIKIKIGIKKIIKFLAMSSEINLIVVSENIIKNIPIKNVENLNLEYFEFSFDEVIRISGTSIRIGI